MVTPRLTTVRMPAAAAGAGGRRHAARTCVAGSRSRPGESIRAAPARTAENCVVRSSTGSGSSAPHLRAAEERRDATSACATSGAGRSDAAWILTTLRTVGFLSITDLARELGVSHMTIRRDLHALESAGTCGWCTAGPASTRRSPREHGASGPTTTSAGPRDRVAAHAAAMVGPTDTIAIDAGPTALRAGAGAAGRLPRLGHHALACRCCSCSTSSRRGAAWSRWAGSCSPTGTRSSDRRPRPRWSRCARARSSSRRPRSTRAGPIRGIAGRGQRAAPADRDRGPGGSRGDATRCSPRSAPARIAPLDRLTRTGQRPASAAGDRGRAPPGGRHRRHRGG